LQPRIADIFVASIGTIYVLANPPELTTLTLLDGPEGQLINETLSARRSGCLEFRNACVRILPGERSEVARPNDGIVLSAYVSSTNAWQRALESGRTLRP